MAKQDLFYIPRLIKNPPLSLLPAHGTALQLLYTASSDDAIVKSLMARSSDTAPMNVVIAISDGVSDYPLGTVAVPANAGNTGAIAAVDLLSGALLPGLPYDNSGKRILPLAAGTILKVGTLVAITAGKQINITSVIEEY